MISSSASVHDQNMYRDIPVTVVNLDHLNDRTQRSNGVAFVIPQDRDTVPLLGEQILPKLAKNLLSRKPKLGYLTYQHAAQPDTEAYREYLESSDYLGNDFGLVPATIDTMRRAIGLGQAYDPANLNQLNIGTYRESDDGNGSIGSAARVVSRYLADRSPRVVSLPPIPYLDDITYDNFKLLMNRAQQVAQAFPTSTIRQPALPPLSTNYLLS
jgi:hypothetical protein